MPNMGHYKQGGMTTQPNTAPGEAGVPNRAKPAGSVPRGEQHQQAPMGTSGANEKKPR